MHVASLGASWLTATLRPQWHSPGVDDIQTLKLKDLLQEDGAKPSRAHTLQTLTFALLICRCNDYLAEEKLAENPKFACELPMPPEDSSSICWIHIYHVSVPVCSGESANLVLVCTDVEFSSLQFRVCRESFFPLSRSALMLGLLICRSGKCRGSLNCSKSTLSGRQRLT